MVRTSIGLFAVYLLLLWASCFLALGQEPDHDNAPTLELKPKHVLKFKDRPTSFSFSRDGKRFAANDAGDSSRVWETHTWKQVGEFTDNDHASKSGYFYFIHSVRLSSDGRTLACATTASNEVHLLDVGSGKVLHQLDGFRASVAAKFSPDGKTIVSMDWTDGLKLWDVETGEDLGRFEAGRFATRSKRIHQFIFSPDGGMLAVAVADGVVHLLDVQNGKELRQFIPTDPALNWPAGLAFSPDGRYLAVGPSMQNHVTVWSVREGKPLWQLKWPTTRTDPAFVEPDPERQDGISALAFTGDSRSLIVACMDKRLRVWEMATGGLRYKAEHSVWVLATSPNSYLFATACGSADTREVSIWDSRNCVPSSPVVTVPALEQAWSKLDSHNAALAYQQMRDLVSAPKDALPLLDKHLPTTESVKASTLKTLIEQLDDDRFEVRTQAHKQLEEVQELAEPALRKALASEQPTETRRHIKELLAALEGTPTGDRLRHLRAVEVLEMIGSSEACRVLKRLGSGAPEAMLTLQAKAALERLNAN